MPSLLDITALASKMPTGSVLPVGVVAGAIPSDYLLCDGAAVSRSVYKNLFAVIGTVYGSGNGTTTFNLPNLSGVFPRAAGNQNVGGNNYSGGGVGSKDQDRTAPGGLTATTTTDTGQDFGYTSSNTGSNPIHNHTYTDQYSTATQTNTGSYSNNNASHVDLSISYSNVARTSGAPNTSLVHNHTITANTASVDVAFSSADPQTMPGYIVVNYMIKA